MPRRTSGGRRSGCPISIALELLGDPWSLLVVRDLLFKKKHTFGEFQQAGESIATNILSDRLARLEKGGIVTRHPDPADARRVRYRLTRKGLDLAPALIELVLWSAKYQRTEAPAAELRAMRHDRRRLLAELRARWTAEARS
jgi:DNA-binding HxlR family transcriptional regulator